MKQILAFSRKAPQEIVLLKLTPLVNETMKFLRASLPAMVHIEVKTRSTSDTVLADMSQMQQVVMNLCTNAGRHAGQWGQAYDDHTRCEGVLSAFRIGPPPLCASQREG